MHTIKIRNLSHSIFLGLYVERYNQLGNIYDDIEKYDFNAEYKLQIDQRLDRHSKMFFLIRYILWMFNIGNIARNWYVQQVSASSASNYQQNKQNSIAHIDKTFVISRGFLGSALLMNFSLDYKVWYWDLGYLRNNYAREHSDTTYMIRSNQIFAQKRYNQIEKMIDDMPEGRYNLNDEEALKTIGLNPSQYRQVVTERDVKLCIRKSLLRCHPDKGGNEEDFCKVQQAISKIKEGKDDVFIELINQQVNDMLYWIPAESDVMSKYNEKSALLPSKY